MIDQTFVPDFPIDKLTEHPENPRRGDVGMIEEMIGANDFYGAVLVQASTNRIIVGNHRTRAARQLGHDTIPALVADIDDDHAMRIMLGDNRANDVAGYDERGLADLLSRLDDLTGTGFRDRDLEILLAKIEHDEPETPEIPVSKAPPMRVQPGDIWRIGDQTVICGDCREPSVYDLVPELAEVHLAFTSPPYGDRRKYDNKTEFRPIHPDRYVEWFEAVQANVGDHLASDGSWIVNIRGGADTTIDMETYVLDLILAHVREWGWHWGAEYCWERVGIPGRFNGRFRNAFEPIYHFARNEWKFRPDAVRHYSDNVPQAIGPGAGPTDWTPLHGQGRKGGFFARNEQHADLAYPSNRLPTFSGEHAALGHPAAFPSGLPKFFIQAYTDPGDIVLDPFVGSGSTLVAAAQTGRTGVGIELSPGYCDIAVNRLEIALEDSAELLVRAESTV